MTLEELEAQNQRWRAALDARDALAARVGAVAPSVTFAPGIASSETRPQLSTLYASTLRNSVPFEPYDFNAAEIKRAQEQRELIGAFFVQRNLDRTLADIAKAQPIAPPISPLDLLTLK